MDEESLHREKPDNTIIFAYGLLIAAVLCLFVPLVPVFMTGGFMLIFTWLLAVALRFGKSPDDLIHNHMTYIARTISAWSSLTFILAMISGMLMFSKADNAAYQGMFEDLRNGIAYTPQESINVMMQYIHDNMALMAIAGVICFVPSGAYIAWRITRGMSRALRNIHNDHPKKWL